MPTLVLGPPLTLAHSPLSPISFWDNTVACPYYVEKGEGKYGKGKGKDKSKDKGKGR
jgi:hypothetical protein